MVTGSLPAQDNPIEVAFYDAGLLNTKGVGIDVDIIAELQRRTSLRFKSLYEPRARIWRSLEQGTLAMSVSGIENPQRDGFAWFVPYLTQRNRAVLLRSGADKYQNLDDFLADRGAMAAVVRGYVHGDVFDRAIATLRSQGRITEVASEDDLFALLATEKRVDLVFALPVFYEKEIPMQNLTDKVVVKDWDPSGAPIKHNLILSKKLVPEATVDKIREAVEAMKNDGTLRKIFGKYLSGSDLDACLEF